MDQAIIRENRLNQSKDIQQDNYGCELAFHGLFRLEMPPYCQMVILVYSRLCSIAVELCRLNCWIPSPAKYRLIPLIEI
jgi:hypothetical protein